GVEDDQRLVVHAQHPGGPDLHQLLQGADAAGQHQEGVAAPVHLALAGPHVGGADQLVVVLARDLDADQRLGDDSDGAGAPGPGGPGDRAHAGDPGAAADQRVTAPGQFGPGPFGEVDETSVDPVAGGAEHADGQTAHQRTASSAD